jgi:hypothetical protein
MSGWICNFKVYVRPLLAINSFRLWQSAPVPQASLLGNAIPGELVRTG